MHFHKLWVATYANNSNLIKVACRVYHNKDGFAVILEVGPDNCGSYTTCSKLLPELRRQGIYSVSIHSVGRESLARFSELTLLE